MYNQIVVSIIFDGHFRVGVYCMVSQEKLKHVCIIGNIFINIQSILTILAQNEMFVMMNINIEKHYYNF